MQKRLQQRLLTAGQLDGLTREEGRAGGRVVGERSVFDEVGGAPGRPAQQRMQASGEFSQIEGFDQIVVGARLQARDAFGHRIAGGQNQHRQVDPAPAQALEKMQAIFVGQPQIENQQIEASTAQQRIGLCRRGGMGHGESLGLEPGDDAAGDERVVFCQQYMHGLESLEHDGQVSAARINGAL